MKVEEIVNRISSWFKGENAPPEMIQMYPTNACNLKCIFCVQTRGIYDLNDTIQKKKWFKISKEICEMGVREVLISGGGEPLCCPDITMGIMKIIKQNNLEGRIITNGTLLNEESIKDIVRFSWDHVIFSLDAPDAETHDFLRGINGTFEKVIKNIEYFNNIKREFNSENPILEFTCVLNVYNFEKVPQLVELAYSLGIQNINIEPVCVNNPEVVKIKLKESQRKIFLDKIIPEAERLAKKYKITNNFDKLKGIKIIEKTGELRNVIIESSEKNFSNLPCYEPWLWPKIEANGDVWPCSSIELKENIRRKSFKKIWYGKAFQDFRKRIIERNLPKECDNCVLTHMEINKLINERLISKNND